MSESFAAAVEQARAAHGDSWEAVAPKDRSAAILHALCRIDSRCQRIEADAGLPPCPASDDFIACRNCRLAVRHGG